MTVTTAPAFDPFDPFDSLRREWKALCARHRHTRQITRWVEAEPALAAAGVRRLADVVPPASTDCSAICAAVGRLHQGGDDLAARALLQLLLPGLIRLASRYRHRFEGRVGEAGGEIISLAGLYIARLRGPVTCSPAGYVLRSIERDLVKMFRAATATSADVIPVGHIDQLAIYAPGMSEDAVPVETVWDELGDAVRDGRMSRHTAQILWLDWAGWPPPEATRWVPYSSASAYRMRTAGYTQLRAVVGVGVGR